MEDLNFTYVRKMLANKYWKSVEEMREDLIEEEYPIVADGHDDIQDQYYVIIDEGNGLLWRVYLMYLNGAIIPQAVIEEEE